MTSSPCRLQLLPYDIIERIIDHLSPSSFAKVAGNVRVPIMHLCPRWCTAYMQKYYSNIVVRCVKGTGGNRIFKIIPPAVGPLPHRVDPVFRTLAIYIPSWTRVVNGEIVNWMQTSPDFTSVNLASVTTLIIDAYTSTSNHLDNSSGALDEAENIAAFFKHIRSVTPNANSIRLLLSKCEQWFSTDKNAKLIEKSIAELVRGRNLTFRDGKRDHCLPNINPAAISGLTSLCYDGISPDTNSDITRWQLEVIRHNAETLKSIKSLCIDLLQLEQFLFSDGSPIIYCSLAKMDVKILDRSNMFKNSTAPISTRYSEDHLNHFPVLKDLTFDGAYIMAIGYLFGPENRLLEHLRVAINSVFPDPLDPSVPCPVNVLTRFYGLRSAKFSTCDRRLVANDHAAEYSTMASNILQSFAGSSSAFYYLSTQLDDGDSMLKLLDSNNLWTSLQGLHAPDSTFSFTDICELLTEAPMLQYLVCALDDEPPTRNGVDLRERPEYLQEHHYPLSASLLKFTLELGSNVIGLDIYNVSLSAIILAGLCPRIRYIRVTGNVLYESEIRDVYFDIDSHTSIAEQANLLSQEIKDTYNDKDYDSDFIDDSY